MSFSFTPPQQQQTPSLFQTPQSSSSFSLFNQSTPQSQPQSSSSFSLFNQSTPQPTQASPFQWQPQAQLQQQQLALPQVQPQAQLQNQQQQQLFLLTNDKAPAAYSTKWADLHPDSQKFLQQIEERILEYRDESQRLDQCSRLYDSSVLNGGFELDASRVFQEIGGISSTMDRHKAVYQELMAVAKDMLRNTEVAVRSFMMLRPRFLHSNVDNETITNAPAPGSGVLVAQTTTNQPAASLGPVFDFYSGITKKPSPFLQQTVIRFGKQISECRQWIEELEQLILLDADRDSLNSASSLLQSLPKVMANVHEFFVHVAAKVESIHQYMESMKTAYLVNQRRRGDMNDPFLEADRRETAKQEAAARRVHPTLHLPAPSQPLAQVAGGSFSSSGMTGALATQTTAAGISLASSGSTFSHINTQSSAPSASLLSTPATSPSFSLFGSSGVSSQPSLFGTHPPSTPATSGSASLFASTPALGPSTFTTPFATGAATGLATSFTSTRRGKPSRTGRR